MDKKQLKRIFNKNIVKDKSFIKMVCFTIVLLLVLVLGNNFGYVSADEAGSSDVLYMNQPDYVSSSVYDSTNFFQGYMGLNNETQIYNASMTSNVIMNADFSSIFTNENTANVDLSEFKYYLLVGNAYPSSWRMYFFNQDCFCFVGLGNVYNYTVILNDNADFYYCDISAWGNGTTVSSPYAILPDTLLHALGSWDSGFGKYAVPFQTTSSTVVCATNMPLLTYKNGTSFTYGSYLNDLLNYNSGATNANVVNINYLYDSGECIPLNGLDGLENCENYGGSSNDDNSYENNMYADSADWILNNFSGDIAHNYKSVSATFTSNLNDYINDIDNIDDYSIEFDAQAYIEYYYNYVVDYGNSSISLGNNFANIQYTTPSLVQTNKYKWSCSYYIPEDIQSYSDFDHVNCSTFASNGYSKTFGFKNLFAAMLPNGTYTDSNGTHNITVRLSQLMQLVDENAIGFVTDSEKTFKIKLTATIVHDSTNTTSGSYSETFDLFTGESVVDDSSMLTNYNPSNDNSDSETSIVPTENNNTVSATTGNVTQTVTVSNEGAKYIPSIISSLIPSSFGDTTTGLASRFTTLVDSNNFITVMANTVPAIPSTVWTYLTEYLGISLYLLACAFVLRLILDLL